MFVSRLLWKCGQLNNNTAFGSSSNVLVLLMLCSVHRLQLSADNRNKSVAATEVLAAVTAGCQSSSVTPSSCVTLAAPCHVTRSKVELPMSLADVCCATATHSSHFASDLTTNSFTALSSVSF